MKLRYEADDYQCQMSLMSFIVKVAAFVGGLHILKWVFGLVTVLVDTLLPVGPRIEKYRAKDKSSKAWAVVTGATAGIGEQFALQLAAAGFSVAIVSRSLDKLTATSESIRAKYPKVSTAEFVLDASTTKPSDYAKLAKWANELGNVSVLINNLGQSHDIPVTFAETSEEEMRRIIQVNDVATLEITKAVLPVIKQTTSSKLTSRGLILTMGSFAALAPTPMLATYAGSKAFLQAWGSALAAELEPSRIDVQTTISYLVTSNMSKVRRTSLLIPNPKSFVSSTLRCIGRRGGAQERAYTMTPYWSHALMHYFISTTLGVWNQVVARINLKMHADIRKRALRKKAKSS